MGYSQAGFDEIVGVDIADQPNYPFEFIQRDAFDFLERPRESDWALRFDLIHASPPCQAFTTMNNRHGSNSPELIFPTRQLLHMYPGPFVIENVAGLVENSTIRSN